MHLLLTKEQIETIQHALNLQSPFHADLQATIQTQLNDFDAEDRAEIIDEARASYAEEGSVEIDDDAILSRSEEGAYVQAWVWVGKEE